MSSSEILFSNQESRGAHRAELIADEIIEKLPSLTTEDGIFYLSKSSSGYLRIIKGHDGRIHLTGHEDEKDFWAEEEIKKQVMEKTGVEIILGLQ